MFKIRSYHKDTKCDVTVSLQLNRVLREKRSVVQPWDLKFIITRKWSMVNYDTMIPKLQASLFLLFGKSKLRKNAVTFAELLYVKLGTVLTRHLRLVADQTSRNCRAAFLLRSAFFGENCVVHFSCGVLERISLFRAWWGPIRLVR